MGLILDTNFFIFAERYGLSDHLRHIVEDQELSISAITLSELHVGLHNALTPARVATRRAFLDHVLEGVAVHSFTAETALIHARLRSGLVTAGQMIGAHDLIIAATALDQAHAVVTSNGKEFRRITGLEVISF